MEKEAGYKLGDRIEQDGLAQEINNQDKERDNACHREISQRRSHYHFKELHKSEGHQHKHAETEQEADRADDKGGEEHGELLGHGKLCVFHFQLCPQHRLRNDLFDFVSKFFFHNKSKSDFRALKKESGQNAVGMTASYPLFVFSIFFYKEKSLFGTGELCHESIDFLVADFDSFFLQKVGNAGAEIGSFLRSEEDSRAATDDRAAKEGGNQCQSLHKSSNVSISGW